MASIRFSSVWKRYGGVTAVADLNLSCGEGQMLALLGPSGCGKSSTLKMAAGIEEVSEGEIYFGERAVSRLEPAARNIAMVFEDYALYPHLSVRENVSFPLRIRGLPPADIKRRADDVLELLGLSALAERGVQKLSGGAQQRIAIGRALVRDPELILFDEPLSHLDAEQKIHLRAEIKRLQKIKAVTSILVTHDQSEAMAMADLIAVMDNGVLQQVATPQDLYECPANTFVASFIGEPPMNLLPLAASDHGLVVSDSGWPLTLDERGAWLAERGGPSGGIIAGVRPEHVRIRPAGHSPSQATVRSCEPRGDTDIVVIEPVRCSGQTIVAEVSAASRYAVDELVSVEFDPEQIFLFASSSRRNLAIPS